MPPPGDPVEKAATPRNLGSISSRRPADGTPPLIKCHLPEAVLKLPPVIAGNSLWETVTVHFGPKGILHAL